MGSWRCLVLLSVVACGSQPARPVEPQNKNVVVAVPPTPVKPVAMAFVVEGHEMWIGNDQTDIAETEKVLGALRPLKSSFGKVSTAGLPAGSTAAVVTYGEKATARHTMAPIATLTAAAFGEQKDYVGVIDRDLVGGVTLGLDELAKARDARRVLVIIGDGTDTNPETAKGALGELAKRAAADHVQVVSFVYKGMLSSYANQIAAFDPNMVTINSMDAMANELEALYETFTPPQVVTMTASSVALVLLVAGSEVWIGNDEIEPANSPSRYVGALKAIGAALDAAPMKEFPAGSQGAIVTYGDKVTTLRKMGPIEKIDAAALGEQKTYYTAAGSELVSGVRAAMAQLAKMPAGRRVLVVLGDGSDTNNDTAPAQLRSLAKTAADLQIEVRAVIWKSMLSDTADVVKELDPNASTAQTTDELTTQVTAVLRAVR